MKIRDIFRSGDVTILMIDETVEFQAGDTIRIENLDGTNTRGSITGVDSFKTCEMGTSERRTVGTGLLVELDGPTTPGAELVKEYGL